jgi:beta-mannosidase
VAEDTWTYSAVFTPPPPLLVAPRLQLTLRGVDTAADVSLNGKLLGSVANAHRRHSFDVSRMLVDVDNRLVLTIRPAAAFSQAQAAAYPYDVPATTQVGSFGRYNFVRKAASDFGWDWGPTFAAAGVSAGVELAALEGALLADVALRQRHHPNGSVTLTADLYLQPGAAQERGRATLAVAAPGGRPLAAAADLEISPLEAELLAQGRWTCGAGVESCGSGGGGSCGAGARPVGTPGWVKRSVSVRLSPPLELWWPWQYGAAALHNVSVTYASDGGGNEQAVQRRVGLRVVELLRLPAGPAAAPGQSFAFRVNGLPLWARGANVVPLDVLETRVSDAQLRRLVRDAQAANMNFLRVWGGGRYAGAAFYDACDEAGVLVWQELMYACAMYPRDASFVVEAQEEARQQALRLGWHASVALWGGNNENEAALAWFPAAAAHRELYAVDQAHLFATKLRDAVLAVDPGAIYLDTSPSNGLVSADPYVKHYGSVDDPTRGDVHYYNYEANLLEQGIYPPARFVSEFGFQSLPSLEGERRCCCRLGPPPAPGAPELPCPALPCPALRRCRPASGAVQIPCAIVIVQRTAASPSPRTGPGTRP